VGRKRRRQFGHVRRLPSGRFQASYIAPDGSRHNAPTTFLSKTDAETFLTLTEGRIIDSKWKPEAPPQSKQPLHEYTAIWLAGRTLKPTTRQTYRSVLDHHILPTLGDRLLGSLRTVEIRAWYAGMDPSKPAARAHAYALLKSILSTAVGDGLIPSNPCTLPRGSSSSKRKRPIEPATLEQSATIAAAMPERYELMVLLATWCALRWGELCELRREDLDLERGRVKVERALTWANRRPIVGDPKSAAGRRIVSVPPHLLPKVKQHLADHVGAEPDALLFPHPDNGGWLGMHTLFHDWDLARRAAGRGDLRFHDLRHTGAVLAAQSGATIKELMNRLGHSTAEMALRYQHASEDRDLELAQKLSELATRG
jgi:integrase